MMQASQLKAELWRSDGTTNGTILLKEIMPGLNSSEISGTTVLNNKLHFSADDEAHGRELWKSDGTSAGTQLVEDLLPGPESSHLAPHRGDLYHQRPVHLPCRTRTARWQ